MNMSFFEPIDKNLYYLKIPFGPVFTSVTLLTGPEPILADTGATEADVDGYIVPALRELGLSVRDLSYVTVTHCHGDHLGGLSRLRELSDRFRLAVFEKSAPKVADPVPYAVRIRTAFPEYSPAPQSFLKGVQADLSLKEGELIGGRLQILHTPGHDDDCVSLLDTETGTLLTGDSLQGNGTISQGVGFYQSLPDYLVTLRKLTGRTEVSRLLLGHDYNGIGYLVSGKKAVSKALSYAADRIGVYHRFIRENAAMEPPALARSLILAEGCGMPEKLFMALYTVREHLRFIERGETPGI